MSQDNSSKCAAHELILTHRKDLKKKKKKKKRREIQKKKAYETTNAENTDRKSTQHNSRHIQKTTMQDSS